MNFKLPLPVWQSLGDVCKNWKASQHDLLKLAADGQLQLHAFIKPYGTTYFRMEGRSVQWVPTTPVVVPPDVAGRLIHEPYVNVDEWQTKDGAHWERASNVHSPSQGLQFIPSALAIFTDEIHRFEAEHAEPVQPDAGTTSSEVGISDSERNNLLRQIAGMALLVSELNGTYRRGGAPSANKIAEEVSAIFDSLPDAKTTGAGNTKMRVSIAEGLNLLKK